MADRRLPRWADLAAWPRWLYLLGLSGSAIATLGLLIDAVTARDWLLTPCFVGLAAVGGYLTWGIRRHRVSRRGADAGRDDA
jgi:hypothetical protein